MANAYYAVSDTRRQPRQRVGTAARSPLSRPSPRVPAGPRVDPRTPLREPVRVSPPRPPQRTPAPRYAPPAVKVPLPRSPLGVMARPSPAAGALGRWIIPATRLGGPWLAVGGIIAGGVVENFWNSIGHTPSTPPQDKYVPTSGWVYYGRNKAQEGLLGWQQQLAAHDSDNPVWQGHNFRNIYVPNYGSVHPSTLTRKGWQQYKELGHYPNGSWVTPDGGWEYDTRRDLPGFPGRYAPPFTIVPQTPPARVPQPFVTPRNTPAPYPIRDPRPRGRPFPRPLNRPLREVAVSIRPTSPTPIIVTPNPRAVAPGMRGTRRTNDRRGTRERKYKSRAAKVIFFAWKIAQDVSDLRDILYEAMGGKKGATNKEKLEYLTTPGAWGKLDLEILVKKTIEYMAEEAFYAFTGSLQDAVNARLGSPLNMREAHHHWDDADPVGSFFKWLEQYGW